MILKFFANGDHFSFCSGEVPLSTDGTNMVKCSPIGAISLGHRVLEVKIQRDLSTLPQKPSGEGEYGRREDLTVTQLSLGISADDLIAVNAGHPQSTLFLAAVALHEWNKHALVDPHWENGIRQQGTG